MGLPIRPAVDGPRDLTRTVAPPVFAGRLDGRHVVVIQGRVPRRGAGLPIVGTTAFAATPTLVTRDGKVIPGQDAGRP